MNFYDSFHSFYLKENLKDLLKEKIKLLETDLKTKDIDKKIQKLINVTTDHKIYNSKIEPHRSCFYKGIQNFAIELKDINNLKELKNKIEFFDENIENGNKNEKIRLLLIEQEIFHILNLKNVDNDIKSKTDVISSLKKSENKKDFIKKLYDKNIVNKNTSEKVIDELEDFSKKYHYYVKDVKEFNEDIKKFNKVNKNKSINQSETVDTFIKRRLNKHIRNKNN